MPCSEIIQITAPTTGIMPTINPIKVLLFNISSENQKSHKEVLDETKDFVIELHGQQNFDIVYNIMNKYVTYLNLTRLERTQIPRSHSKINH